MGKKTLLFFATGMLAVLNLACSNPAAVAALFSRGPDAITESIWNSEFDQWNHHKQYRHEYDSSGRVTALKEMVPFQENLWQDYAQYTFERDNGGNVTSIVKNVFDGSWYPVKQWILGLDANSRPASVKRASNQLQDPDIARNDAMWSDDDIDEWQFDENAVPENWTDYNSYHQGWSTNERYQFDYDAFMRLTGATRYTYNSGGGDNLRYLSPPGWSTRLLMYTYTYDDQGRLISQRYWPNGIDSQNYREQVWTYDDQNRVIERSYTYYEPNADPKVKYMFEYNEDGSLGKIMEYGYCSYYHRWYRGFLWEFTWTDEGSSLSWQDEFPALWHETNYIANRCNNYVTHYAYNDTYYAPRFINHELLELFGADPNPWKAGEE